MTSTVKLVLDNLLTVSLASYYQYVATASVLEVVVTPRCLAEAITHTRRKLPDLHMSLALLAIRRFTTDPLHVTVQLEGELAFHQLCQVFRAPPSIGSSFNIPITYEIFNMPTGTTLWQHLAKAFTMRAVVHFAPHPTPAGPGNIAAAIGDQLLDCFGGKNLVTFGQLYLCDIPELVLSPAELATASDPDEAALLKLFDNLIATPLLGASLRSPNLKPKWETFKSKVKLVKSGFRPSMSDLTDAIR